MTETPIFHNAILSSLSRTEWIKDICYLSNKVRNKEISETDIVISLPDNINKDNIHPVHLVTLGCLVKQIIECNFKITLSANQDFIKYLAEDLHITEYFKSNNLYTRENNI